NAVRLGLRLYDKFTPNRNESHSTVLHAEICSSSADATAGIAAHSHARRAAGGCGNWPAARTLPSRLARSGYAWRARLGPRFPPSDLRQPGSAQGWPACARRRRHLRLPQPVYRQRAARTNMRGYIIESLLARGYDEPLTLYGLLADSVATDTARSFVTFSINPAARFSDGRPVTPADVIFSWELLRDKGRPNFRTYYTKVVKAEATDTLTVRFDLSGADDRELPLIIGLMPVLAKHAINPATFEET